MCSTSTCDLEDIPLDDDDPNSIEFKILAFYTKHHVLKSAPAVFSPKLPRTRSLSQKGLGSWAAESWTQMPWPCRQSSSSEKPIQLGKKKSSWKTLFGGTEKEESPQSSPQFCFQGPVEVAPQGGIHGQQWSWSRSSVERHLDNGDVDPKVASIANRVADIVHSWPPSERTRLRGGGLEFKDKIVRQGHRTPKESLKFVSQGSHTPKESLKVTGTSSKQDGEDQIISKIVELLKFSGDQLDRELKKDKTLPSNLQDIMSYSVFKTITDQFLGNVDTRGESEVKAQGFKAALAIDAIGKLTAIDNHPMNRVLGFGTKYLKENFSPWVQQHGGWEKILGISHEEVD
ncbi:apoptosis facilitator Bcl-2-like protein 14 [Ictidomys tridecemlineatus]|uniref:apoptosis facilitator Bcl-2-like protein 14 n=1 Tax=Ictidomys tridecemlineatus TaxID=43179 RepID=UPI00038C01A0|nr:apoptosis facilitator Bcl-2-like protein 14 [Ictidomys tridecemlineatus]XP_040136911.1 apoptosis facilitator Bcl-2-like protein 14 [Ictidomys tridecemlineatus]KAG3292379.1 BCL2 like 14 [Ictidomys tridecemlineatus]